MIGVRKQVREPVKPDVMITPFLGLIFASLALAFLILAFPIRFGTEPDFGFLISTSSASEETLRFGPPQDGTKRFVVSADAKKDGSLKKVSLSELGLADVPKVFGNDLAGLKKELRSRYDALKGQPAKLILEIDDHLSYSEVVTLIDIAIAAGFTDVSPVSRKWTQNANVETN